MNTKNKRTKLSPQIIQKNENDEENKYALNFNTKPGLNFIFGKKVTPNSSQRETPDTIKNYTDEPSNTFLGATEEPIKEHTSVDDSHEYIEINIADESQVSGDELEQLKKQLNDREGTQKTTLSVKPISNENNLCKTKKGEDEVNKLRKELYQCREILAKNNKAASKELRELKAKYDSDLNSLKQELETSKQEIKKYKEIAPYTIPQLINNKEVLKVLPKEEVHPIDFNKLDKAIKDLNDLQNNHLLLKDGKGDIDTEVTELKKERDTFKAKYEEMEEKYKELLSRPIIAPNVDKLAKILAYLPKRRRELRIIQEKYAFTDNDTGKNKIFERKIIELEHKLNEQFINSSREREEAEKKISNSRRLVIELQCEIKSKDNTLSTLKQQLELHKKDIDKLKKALANKDAEFAEKTEEIKSIFNEMRKEKKKKQSEIALHLKKIPLMEKELEETKASLANLQDEYNRLKNQYDQLLEELKVNNKLDKTIEKFQNEALVSEIDKLKAELLKSIDEINKMKELLGKFMKTVSDKVPFAEEEEAEIVKLFGEDSKEWLDELYKKSQEDENAKNKIEKEKQLLSNQVNDLTNTINALKDEEINLKKQNEELTKESLKLKEDLVTSKAKNNSLEDENRFLKERIKELEEEINNLKKLIDELQKANNLLEQSTLNEATQKTRKDKESLEFSVFKEENAKLEDNIQKLQEDNDLLNKTIDELSKTNKGFEDEIERLEEECKKALDDKEGLNELIKKLNEEIAAFKTINEGLKGENEKLSNTVKDLQEENNNLRSKGEEYENNIRSLQDEIERLKEEGNNLKQKVEELTNENTSLKAEIEKLRDELKKAMDNAEQEKGKLEKELIELREKIKRLEEEIERLKADESLNTIINELQEENNTLKFAIEKLKEDNETLKTAIEELEEEGNTLKAEIEQHKEENEILRTRIEEVPEIKGESFTDINASHIEDFNNELKDKMNKLTQELTKRKALINVLKAIMKMILLVIM